MKNRIPKHSFRSVGWGDRERRDERERVAGEEQADMENGCQSQQSLQPTLNMVTPSRSEVTNSSLDRSRLGTLPFALPIGTNGEAYITAETL